MILNGTYRSHKVNSNFPATVRSLLKREQVCLVVNYPRVDVQWLDVVEYLGGDARDILYHITTFFCWKKKQSNQL
jgi:hypothetical protein